MRQSSSPGPLKCLHILLSVPRLQGLIKALPEPLLSIYITSKLGDEKQVCCKSVGFLALFWSAVTQTAACLTFIQACGVACGNWHKYADTPSACCTPWVIEAFACDQGSCVFCQHPQNWQANLLGKIKPQTWLFQQQGLECWQRHTFLEGEPSGQVWEYSIPWNQSGSQCCHSR